MSDATLFRDAIETLQPGAGGRAMVALLDGKVSRYSAIDWHRGRRRAPLWALRILASKLRSRAVPQIELADRLERAKERPGKQAGTLNLMRYLATR